MAVKKYLSLLPLAAVMLAYAPAAALAAGKPQAITFTSPAPSDATVGGSAYTVTAEGGASGNQVVITIDEASKSVCTLAGNSSGSMVSFQHVGTCTIDANQAGNAEYDPAPQAQQTFTVGQGKQTIVFSSPPSNPKVMGETYTVSAAGGPSGNPVTFTIDEATEDKCTISSSTVSFIGAGLCTIDAHQAGNSDYKAAEEKQTFEVGKGMQTITFTSTAPTNATVGGPGYSVTARGGFSGQTVALAIDPASRSVCTISGNASGSTVSFIGAGTCTIDASQEGSQNYEPAPPVSQSFVVTAAPSPPAPSPPAPSPPAPPPIVQVKPVVIPNSSFKVMGASLSLATYAITFVESVVDPGTFSWVMTFENGKFGVFAARVKKCRSGSIRLKGKCRPARVLFARGRQTVATAGSVTFTVRPTRAGVKALKKAFKRKKGLPVTAVITYQSLRGGRPASRMQSLIVKGRR